jgi:hypothetical protein
MLLPSSLALCPIKTTWGIWLSINSNTPACASFDMFDDFEQRGDAFKRTIKDII